MRRHSAEYLNNSSDLCCCLLITKVRRLVPPLTAILIAARVEINRSAG